MKNMKTPFLGCQNFPRFFDALLEKNRKGIKYRRNGAITDFLTIATRIKSNYQYY